MRLWSLHHKYLDAKGIVALWREGLLARKVLMGLTRGYRHHPQLDRFRNQKEPIVVIDAYLGAVYHEADQRGYRFDKGKISPAAGNALLTVTNGQLRYEFLHLLQKLRQRDQQRFQNLCHIELPDPHPLFRVVDGGLEPWEIVTTSR